MKEIELVIRTKIKFQAVKKKIQLDMKYIRESRLDIDINMNR